MGTSEKSASDPKASGVALAGIIGSVIVFSAIIALLGLYNRAEQGEVVRQTYGRLPQELQRLRAGQMEQLNSYRWLDPKKGIAALPIERAMELIAAEAQAAPAEGKHGRTGR